MIDMQISAISTRNLNEDFAKEQAAKREQNLKNLRQKTDQINRKPQSGHKVVTQPPEDDYCAQDVDLTVNAVHVPAEQLKSDCQRCTDTQDSYLVAPKAKQGVSDEQEVE